jgi:hypothetical protein
MIKLLGSAKFALLLILLTAGFVIAATIIEAHSGSHGLAEKWVYHSPLFKLLLIGFFINILFSTFTRWPFKKRHIPFLITHLGLLMVILGVFVKQQFGVQGTIHLMEGEATNLLIVKDQPVIALENRRGEIWQYALGASLPHPITLKHVASNSKEAFLSWIHHNALHLHPFPPLPLPVDQKLTIDGRTIHVYAKDSPLPDSIIWGNEPFVYFFKDSLYYGNGFGAQHEQALNPNLPASYVLYDKGFQGYTAFLTLPFESSPDPYLEDLLESHKESLSPPLALLYETCSKAKVPFGETAVEALKACDQQKSHWIEPLIHWKSLSEYELNAMRWARELIKDLPSETSLQQHLKTIGWPYADGVERLSDLLSQLLAVKEELPPLNGNEQLLSIYLALYDIDYKSLVLSVPLQQAYKIEIESPIQKEVEFITEVSQLENNKPAAVIASSGQEQIVVFDSPIKTALHAPDLLISLQNEKRTLPFEVRLHQAKDIKYPGTDQTESYECCLTVGKDKVDVSMNRVHETKDGYRLYLSGMSIVDPYQVRAVQLVVNRDPAKYLLTYPGALLIALGIVGLFFYTKRARQIH